MTQIEFLPTNVDRYLLEEEKDSNPKECGIFTSCCVTHTPTPKYFGPLIGSVRGAGQMAWLRGAQSPVGSAGCCRWGRVFCWQCCAVSLCPRRPRPRGQWNRTFSASTSCDKTFHLFLTDYAFEVERRWPLKARESVSTCSGWTDIPEGGNTEPTHDFFWFQS